MHSQLSCIPISHIPLFCYYHRNILLARNESPMARIVPFPGDSDRSDTTAPAGAPTPGTDPTKEKFYVLGITVLRTHVPLEREVILPASRTLDQLSGLIQILMGWGGHCYFFSKNKKYYDDPILLDESADENAPGEEHFDASQYAITELLPRKGSTATYVYDMGDWWEMKLKVLDVIPSSEYPFMVSPVCTSGRGNQPPEDVGGPSGFERFCDAVNDPAHEEYEQYRTWAGLREDDFYDPRYFDLATTNEDIAWEMVNLYADEVVPKDPDRLREGYIELLSRVIGLRVARQVDRMQMPLGNELLQLLADLAQIDPEALGLDRGDRESAVDDFDDVLPSFDDLPLPPFDDCDEEAFTGPYSPTVASPEDAPEGEEDYEAYERAVAINEKDNAAYLEEFDQWLRASGLSEKTVCKHLDNVEFYLNTFLQTYEAYPMPAGCYLADDYFGYFFVRKCMWSTPSTIKTTSASLKKFYRCMLERGHITQADFDFLKDTIKERLPEWQNYCAAFNGGSWL